MTKLTPTTLIAAEVNDNDKMHILARNGDLMQVDEYGMQLPELNNYEFNFFGCEILGTFLNGECDFDVKEMLYCNPDKPEMGYKSFDNDGWYAVYENSLLSLFESHNLDTSKKYVILNNLKHGK